MSNLQSSILAVLIQLVPECLQPADAVIYVFFLIFAYPE